MQPCKKETSRDLRSRIRRHRGRTFGTALAAAAAGLPLALVATTPTPASASPAPITIAYITDLTGPGAAENSTSPAGFEARLDLHNAQGGVDTIQNSFSNPDVVVEVRDEKIYAVRFGHHHDANEKPIPNTEEGRRRVERALGGR